MSATRTSEADLAELRTKYVPRGITSAHPIAVDRARGSELWDVSGKRYIDFAGGIGVMNVGHAHPRVMKAVHDQLEKATHTSFQVVHYESYLKLAQRLCEVTARLGMPMYEKTAGRPVSFDQRTAASASVG